MTLTDMKIPKFKSVDEELEFWSTHSALEFMDQGEEVEIDFTGAREKRAKRETQQISIRLPKQLLEGTKQRAATLGVPYQTLMQIWLAERLEAEQARSLKPSARQA